MTQELITMTSKEQERYQIIERLIRKEINGTEAAKQMGLSLRQTKRIKKAVKKDGIKGVIHGARGRESNRKIPEETEKKIHEILKKKEYKGFGPTFASEKLDELYGIKIGKEKLRQSMTKWNLWWPKLRKKNKEYRSWRARKERFGEMEQFDGSYHDWFEDRGPKCCLLASIDDAKKEITKLKFVHWEGVKEAFSFWKEYVEKYGKPVSIYLDRHSTYKQNQKSVFDDPKVLTQFQRAMEDLRIEVIHAHSPQAKGRVERLFETLQDRLIKEMRLVGISTVRDANKFVEKVFISKCNAKFGLPAQKRGNLHRPLIKTEEKNLERIFSRQEKRVVANDFTVRYDGKYFQLSETQPTMVLRKDKVLVEERIDGKIFISLRGKNLSSHQLPERPKRIKMRVTALTKEKQIWKPPADHPWRNFVIRPKYNSGQRIYD